MSLLIFALIVVIIAALVIWAIRTIPMDGNLSTICTVAVIVIAVLVIANRAGFV